MLIGGSNEAKQKLFHKIFFSLFFFFFTNGLVNRSSVNKCKDVDVFTNKYSNRHLIIGLDFFLFTHCQIHEAFSDNCAK